MQKKTNRLQAALSQQAHGPQVQPEPANTSAPPIRKEASRAGKVMVSGWLPIEAGLRRDSYGPRCSFTFSSIPCWEQ
jgi:hypothetical protein